MRIIKLHSLDLYRIILARFFNLLWYRSRASIFRALSNRLAFGVSIKAGDIFYIITCVSDLYEVVPEYEQEVFKKILKLVQPGSVFIDVGAHIGRYSFPLAKLVGKDGLVIAIEPDPLAFRALSMGIKLNNLRNVLALNIALGDSEGKAILCQKLISATSSIIEFDKCQRFIEVSLKRLDNVVEELELTRINVIKIDVEGAEIQVLKGAVKTIKRFKPLIIVEVRNSNIKEFEQIMRSLGYSCEELIKTLSDKVFMCHSIA